MRRYETIFIFDPDLSEDGRKERLNKNKDLIKQMNGVLVEVDDWGNKRLAYEIKKKLRGHYLRLDYCGNGELINEMERLCRIDDKYLKFMTIVLAEKADPEAILAEKENKEAAEVAKVEAEAKAKEVVKETETPKAEAKEAVKETETPKAEAKEAVQETEAPEVTESKEEDN